MANAIDLKGKLVFLVVTGASKGIGARMAIEASRGFQSGSVVVLLARTIAGLEATKQAIVEANGGVKVVVRAMDLTKPPAEELHALIKDAYASVPFELAMIIHNVGTIGDISKWSRDQEDYAELEAYYSTNVFGPIVLNTQLLKVVPAGIKRFVVNISSKAGHVPFKSFGFYCPGKAAREMYFRVLAEEENDILVLNYSPGPVETDMTVDAQAHAASEETTSMFKTLRDEGTILTTEQTTKRFLEVVATGNYKSGGHVDFYDEI